MTVGTNALLEERGARTALIATEGFTDLLEIGRQNRPSLYHLCAPKPAPLVDPELKLGVDERVGPHGVVAELDPASLERAVDALRDSRRSSSGVESVAVCLLFAYLDPGHEATVAERLREALPDVHVSVSHEVLPQFREYERCSTTVIDAYLSPLLGRYLSRLGGRAGELGLPEPLVMQSSGGVAPAKEAARAGAWSVLSGPAGGAVGAGAAGRPVRQRQRDRARHGRDVVRRLRRRRRGGQAHRLARDRGPGPAAADGRRAHRRRRRRVDRLAGLRRRAARRATLRRRRAGTRLLRARRQRADGHRRQPRARLSGRRLDPGRRRRARRRAPRERAVARLGAELGLDALETAEGIVRVANQEMVRALRVVTVERGVDPRDYELMPFGGRRADARRGARRRARRSTASSARARAACCRRSA